MADCDYGKPQATINGDEQHHSRADLEAFRVRKAKALATLQVEKASIEGQRKVAEADLGPVRSLAMLIGAGDQDVLGYFHGEFEPDQPIVPTATKKLLQRHGPVYRNTYVENIAGQVRPLIRERLPAHGFHRREPM